MKWLMIQYTLPSSPSKYRVYVWRKLKKLGACPLLDGLYVLPASERSLERFVWLNAEIREMNGNAMLWEAESLLPGQEELIRTRLQDEIQNRYLALKQEIDAFAGPEADHPTVSAWSRQWADIRWHDWFGHPLGTELLNTINSKRKPRNTGRVI